MKKEKVQAATCYEILNTNYTVQRDNVCVLAAGLKSVAISGANAFFAGSSGADPANATRFAKGLSDTICAVSHRGM
jgi:hypothetical protein